MVALEGLPLKMCVLISLMTQSLSLSFYEPTCMCVLDGIFKCCWDVFVRARARIVQLS